MPAPVEPVLRALAVVEALNQGTPVMSLQALAVATNLPKPTVARLLDTLIAGGYVQRLPLRGGYALAERVVRLSGGFRHADAVVEAARPFLSALTAMHKWPLAIATLDHDAMLIRASTLKESPFGTDHSQLNRHTPMLVSALGRAYLAFCPDEERETILSLLRKSNRENNRPARDPRYIRDLVRTIRRQGYAITAPVPGDPSVGIAVPILGDGRVHAAMTLRYLSSMFAERAAAQRFLPSLQEAARNIAAALRA
ncbi:MAG TPA: DNA-binding transcriptional regulator [Rhizomicrobium sp.]|nr:DNA-binding transcriptional regulator [Rhizomicrobium sp.]